MRIALRALRLSLRGQGALAAGVSRLCSGQTADLVQHLGIGIGLAGIGDHRLQAGRRRGQLQCAHTIVMTGIADVIERGLHRLGGAAYRKGEVAGTVETLMFSRVSGLVCWRPGPLA